jgi:RNA polymerase sigma-70 factor (ECF subfamily)
VSQARAGDLDAFARLVRTLHPRVFRWALAFAVDADDAEDIAQEAFVIALRRLGQYRGSGTFSVWLYRVTRRAAGHLRRTRTRRARLAAGPRAAPDRVVYETDPGARIDRERLSALVRRCWEELPERQRAVIDLVDLQGHTPAAAADMLELNPVTLRANLFKARQSIRRRLIAQLGSDSPWTDR